MPGLDVESIDRRLLAQLQRSFPLVPRPYRELAAELGVAEKDILDLIRGFRERGLLRQISPVIDARRLGYQSTLIAAEVPVRELDRAEEVLVQHPRISHAYERDNKLNVWFTLSTNDGTDIEEEVRSLGLRMGAAQAFSLPALRLFKIGAFFGTEGEEPVAHPGQEMPRKVALSSRERKVVNVLQQDLPLTSSPFEAMAEEAGMTTAELLSTCGTLIDRGVIRRFGASVNHRKAGYEGNGMACWQVPSEAVESVGQRLAAVEAVSHCYERRTNQSWHYNLFAMFHGGTPVSCSSLVKETARSLDLPEYLLLFSTREIRKTRVKYLA